ncbi:MAG: DsrH/TusB family sulfur metabolism protein [Gammaproteobacteria bacterium]|nr:DsrH/TusB family sulfur metabolism protein [Gammaproteobacteria bacterium]
MKVLNVIATAYRATLEEQDDTVVWLSHAMKGAGADLDVLLRGSAVNYAVKGQDAAGLRFGDEPQTQPPQLAGDLSSLMEKGVTVYVMDDDLQARGIQRDELISGLEHISRDDVVGVLDRYDQVWHW